MRMRALLNWLHARQEPLARAPWLAAKEVVYDRSYFADLDALHADAYRRFADALVALVHPRSAVDVGCGTGQILARLAEHGVEATGVEGSRHAIAASPLGDRIVRANLERPLPPLGRFDVCLCIEVAEHLPKRRSGQLVDTLAALSDLVVFTAAQPGQGGTDHVNEQPRSFWLDLFGARGLHVDHELEEALRGAVPPDAGPAYLRDNLIAVRRPRA